MKIEKELWGEIDKQLYEEKLAEFTNRLGKPKNVRRLAFRFGPNGAHHINTRIRITNGNAKILQKIHDVSDHSAKEYEVDISNDEKTILALFRTYQRILSHYSDVHFYLLRFENMIFADEGFEIKLTHQFGNQDIYSFEVELLEEGLSVKDKFRELGLSPNLEATTDEFWLEFNKRVNVDISDTTDSELEKVVREFL